MTPIFKKIIVLLSVILLPLLGVILERFGIISRVNRVVERKIRENSLYYNEEKSINIRVRNFNSSADPKQIDDENNSEYINRFIKLNLSNIALILVDVWKTHPNDGFQKRVYKNVEDKIVPLLKIARMNKLTIIHVPSNNEEMDEVKPSGNDIVFNSDNPGYLYTPGYGNLTNEFDEFLRSKNITTLIYAGFATNVCLLFRPTGILESAKNGYRIILVRDATLALESPETLGGGWATIVSINMIESQFGSSTTVNDILNSFKEFK